MTCKFTVFYAVGPLLSLELVPALCPSVSPALVPELGPSVSPVLVPVLGPLLSLELVSALGPLLSLELVPVLGPLVSLALVPAIGSLVSPALVLALNTLQSVLEPWSSLSSPLSPAQRLVTVSCSREALQPMPESSRLHSSPPSSPHSCSPSPLFWGGKGGEVSQRRQASGEDDWLTEWQWWTASLSSSSVSGQSQASPEPARRFLRMEEHGSREVAGESRGRPGKAGLGRI